MEDDLAGVFRLISFGVRDRLVRTDFHIHIHIHKSCNVLSVSLSPFIAIHLLSYSSNCFIGLFSPFI